MDRELTHDELQALIGAYALDAVDADEREAMELHLLECPRCRAEVAEHREVAAFLAHNGHTAPEGLWDRIAGRAGGGTAAARPGAGRAVAGRGARAVCASRRRWRRPPRWWPPSSA